MLNSSWPKSGLSGFWKNTQLHLKKKKKEKKKKR